MRERKITAVILAVLMIFSTLAVFPAGAKSYSPLTLSAADAAVDVGAATADVIVSVGNVPSELGISAAAFKVSVSGGASIKNITKLLPSGTGTYSNNAYMWVDDVTGLFESSEFAKITVQLPATAKAGDVFNVTLSVFEDPDYCLTFYEDASLGDLAGLGATVSRSAKITVNGKPVPDYDPLTLSAADVSVGYGASTADVIVSVGSVSAELGVSAITFKAAVSGGASIKNITKLLPTGTGTYSNNAFMWVDAATGLFESSEFAKITVQLPANAKAGDVFNVTLSVYDDPDYCLTFNEVNGDVLGVGATVVRNAKVSVVGEPVPDYGPLTISATDVSVAYGTATADVIVTLGNIPTDLGICSALVRFTVDGGATVASAQKLVSSGSGQLSNNSYLWADASNGVFAESVEFVRLRVELPATARIGDEFHVTLIADEDPDYYLTFDEINGDTLGLGATVTHSATITVTGVIPQHDPVTLSAPSVTAYASDGTASFDITVGDVPTDLGLSTARFGVKVPGAKVTRIVSRVSGSSLTNDLPAETAYFTWADIVNGVFDQSFVLATVTISLDKIALDTEVPIILTADVDPDNYLTFNEEYGDVVGLGATATNGAITVISHTHTIAYVAKIAPGCVTPGSAAHYVCTGCGKTFSDSQGNTEFDPTIPAVGHSLVYVAEVAPTCEADGFGEHYKCERCGKLFVDSGEPTAEYPATPAAGSKIVVKAPIVSVSEGVDVVTVDVVLDNISSTLGLGSAIYSINVGDALVTKAANKLGGSSAFIGAANENLPDSTVAQAWASQDGVFAGPVTIASFTVDLPDGLVEGDENPITIIPSDDPDNFLTIVEQDGDVLGLGAIGVNGKIVVTKAETTVDALTIPALGHRTPLTHYAAVEPHLRTDGNIEYWVCERCGKYFSDSEAKHEITYEDTIVVFPYELGDANGDGKINSRDITLIMKAAIPGFVPPANYIFETADMNEDGKINSRDVTAIMKEVLRRTTAGQ